mmetsp:Transcript_35646/g.65332  ORF Transcript_35646/g.65332 Transcript_35646/m.65332 type:complete len:654 (+) Transcript_35646:17-1978(+)
MVDLRSMSRLLLLVSVIGHALAEPRYLLSSNAICPTGGERVRSKDECLSASSALLLDYAFAQDDSRAQYPHGCYLAPGSGGAMTLYWNAVGANHSDATLLPPDARSICSWGDQPPEDEQLGYLGSCSTEGVNPDHANIPVGTSLPSTDNLPEAYDVRDRYSFCFDNAVRNQGSCGSCWAFAATSVVQHRACIYDCDVHGRCDDTNALIGRHVSVQHVMGCSADSRSGCSGGWAHHAFDALQDQVAWEYEVPYRCGGGNIEDQFDGVSITCTSWPWATPLGQCPIAHNHVQVTSYYRLGVESMGPTAASELMAAEIVANGPIAVDFCVRNNFFGYWRSVPTRIYVEADGCGEGTIVGGHMVLLVGFGVADDGGQVKYWTAQNSWSSGWGDAGFFRIQRGINLCGIETGASAVVVTVEDELPPVPNTTTRTTSTLTQFDPNSSPTTTTTTRDPNATLPVEESSDDGLIEVPHYLVWLLAVLTSVFFTCCCVACCCLACIMYLKPQIRRDWTDVAVGKATVNIRPTRQVDSNSSSEMETGEAQAAAFSEVTAQNPYAQPVQDPFTQQHSQNVQKTLGASIWGKSQESAGSKTSKGKGKGKRPLSIVPGKASRGPTADAPSKEVPSEDVPIPPWWRQEPDRYVDNVQAREDDDKGRA